MKKKKWMIPLSIFGGAIMLCIGAVFVFGVILSGKGYGISSGRLYFAENGTYLIDSEDMAMRVSDCSDDAELFKGYQNGDKVILIHDGIETSYPAETGGYCIFRLSKGDGTYKPADEVLGIQTLGDDGYLLVPQEVDYSEQTDDTHVTIYFDNEKRYTVTSEKAVIVTDILANLEYDKNKICKCLPEYRVDTKYGTYGIHITEGYARCDKGQAELTQEQVDKLEEMIQWAKEEAGFSSINVNYPKYTFSLTWGVYGISSYDSETETLIKTKDATNPNEYKTTLKLSDEQYSKIWKLIKKLDIESYPDKYNPQNSGVSTPYMTLILSVKAEGIDKTIKVEETMLSDYADNIKGQKFLDVCNGISDILTETEEWKALPEYEFFYD